MDKIKEHMAMVRVHDAIAKFGNKVFCGHSGGKDSVVIHHLTSRLLPSVWLVHNVKPLLDTVKDDPIAKLTAMYPETLDFLYSKVAAKNKVHFMPASMMEQWVRDNNFKCQIDGARTAEAFRPGKSANFIRNGINVNRTELTPMVENGMFGLTVCYPIFDWSDDDVFDYILEHKLELSDEYIANGELMAYMERTKRAK